MPLVGRRIATMATSDQLDMRLCMNISDSPQADTPSSDGLLEALASTFSLIIFGYCAGRFRWLPPPDLGLAQFIGRVALPALVFVAIATLDINGLNWNLVVAIATGKTIIFVLVGIVTYITNRHSEDVFAMAGIRGIFVTQSNDFALGLPLISAVYPSGMMDRYLYVAAPISFLWLNLIAFTMMEYSNRRKATRAASDSDDKRSLVLVVFIGVITNPIIFMTLIALLLNICLGGRLPVYIDKPVNILANAFSAGALVMLGMSMTGRIFYLRGPRLLVGLALVLTKTTLLAIVTKAIFIMIDNGNENEANFTFIYSTFPTAPGVLAFALQYNVEAINVASMVVMCTLLSAPIMFIMGRIALLPDEEDAVVSSANNVAYQVGTASAVFSGITILLLMCNLRYRYMLDRAIIGQCIATLLYSIAGALCMTQSLDWTGIRVRHAAAYFGWFNSVLFTIVYALTIHAVTFQKASYKQLLNRWIPILCVVISTSFTIVVAFVEPHKLEGMCFLREWGSQSFGYLMVKIIFPFIAFVTLIIVATIRATSGQLWGMVVEEVDNNSLYDDEAPTFEEASPLISDAARISSASSSMSSVYDESEENRMIATDFRHSTYLLVETIFQLLSVLHAALSFSGTCPYELDWVDTFFSAARGILLFVCFATDGKLFVDIQRVYTKLSTPLIKPIRKLVYNTEESYLQHCREWLLSVDCQESRHECLKIIPILMRDRAKLESTRTYGLRRYKKVFTGRQMVDWMIENSFAGNRQHAEILGRTLLSHGCFKHVTSEHHFWDAGYFYRLSNLAAVMQEVEAQVGKDGLSAVCIDSPDKYRGEIRQRHGQVQLDDPELLIH